MEEEQSLVLKFPFSAVFNNLDIVEKILEGVTDDIRSNMELRLVNRMFRDAYHVNLRRTHRNLKIEYIKGRTYWHQNNGLKGEFITTDRIYINQCRFNISNLNNYFHLLDDIANVCVQSTQSKDDCLNAVSDLIPSNISCETLILKISEQRNEWINPGMDNEMQERLRRWPIADHQPMPREVIEVMLKQWNVQSVVLKFVYKHHRKEHAGEWTRKDLFTKLCFKDPYVIIKKSDPKFKIKEVLVDLTDSLECNVHLAKSHVYSVFPGYADLPSKIRRVFLNDKLKILFSHYRTDRYSKISSVVDSLMERIDAEAPRNLEVEIMNLYLSWKNDIDYFDELSKKEPDERPAVYNGFFISKLPNRINISHKTLSRKDQSLVQILKNEKQPFVKEEWVGRRFQLINEARNCIINWTMFENDHLLDKNRRVYI
ncbi:hypothetical protein CAEBREN_03640 [Caenorhabditis brenneri]|uniref:Uncharacterized protein n=1 Tax=Caenorhabditis brenneri TaxID=135651 RepID=G0MPL8_CAEBE|nr:hypothetical protein CAEBREN_03640 [Caenorhabditis brenneri]